MTASPYVERALDIEIKESRERVGEWDGGSRERERRKGERGRERGREGEF